jgi:drug/metabolite transporter (DMT)-like permease
MVSQARDGHLRLDPRVLLAFAAIWFVWGSTFPAIRILVLQIPPLFAAGMRFSIAGLALFTVLRLLREPNPSAREWRNLVSTSLCMFVLTYGPLFWAEQYVTSSVTSILEATLPITTLVLEVFVFRSQALRWREMTGVALGFIGVLLLLFRNEKQDVPLLPSLVILAAAVAWSTGAVLSKRLSLPSSRALTAACQMMLGGFVLLGLSLLRGELHTPPHFTLTATLAVIYLIVFARCSPIRLTCGCLAGFRPPAFPVTPTSTHWLR